MKEYTNFISQYYGSGSQAKDIPGEKLVFTEHELQRALSRALLENGVPIPSEYDTVNNA